VCGQAVGGGPLRLLGCRQVVGDVDEGELLLLLMSLLLATTTGWMGGSFCCSCRVIQHGRRGSCLPNCP